MTETVGRVDFIADLDGRNLPRKARELGEKIGREGGKSFSEKFGKEMDSTLDRRMSDTANRVADTLGKRGKLAGSKFSKDFNSAVTSQFRSMQREVVDILSSRDSFERFARGFDTVGEAVDRLKLDLGRLSGETYEYRDSLGRLREGSVLTERELARFSRTAERLGQEFQVVRDHEDALVIEHERMREAVKGLEEDHRLLNHRIADLDAFRAYSAELGSAGRAHRELGAEIDRLGEKLGLSHVDMDLAREKLDETRLAALKQDSTIRGLSARWNDLSHNTRQWSLIIGAVAAGIQDLSVLSSAAGAGLFAIGGGLTALVGGAGAAVAVFSVLGQDLSKLPPSMRDVVAQAKNLGAELTNTRDIIAGAAFQQMPTTFDKLSDTVRRLSPELSALGDATGQVFDDFADGVAQGSEGMAELRTLISNAADDFPALAQAAGTWTLGLTRGINRANPLVDQLIGYVQELGDRFDAFSRSRDFEDWIARSSTTFTSFGHLLDATGRALNDLVTPASTRRTQEFLDNLTAFMPNLSRMLDIIGRLDVFGLAAQALNDFGRALEPIAEPLGRVADELNDTAQVIIGTLADALGVAATLISPVVEGLADLADAIPPEVLSGLAIGIGGVALAIKGLSVASALLAGAQSFALATDGMYGFLNVTDQLKGKIDGLTPKLKGLAGKAGVFGLIALGVGVASTAFVELMRDMQGIDEVTRKAIASNKSFADSYSSWAQATGVVDKSLKDFDDLDAVLDGLSGNSFWQLTFPFGVNQEISTFRNSLKDLDAPLTALAQRNLPEATQQFAAWASEMGATDQQVLNMLGSMDGFRGVLEDASIATGQLGTDQDILALALQGGTGAIQTQDQVIAALTGSLNASGAEVDALSEKMRKFAEQNLITRSASREYEAAVDDLTEKLKLNGAALDATGTEFDITTEKGRENQTAVDQLASSVLRLSDETLKQTGSQKAANDTIAAGREQLINQLTALGFTTKAAQDYADKLGLIPKDISTRLALENAKQLEDQLNKLTRNRTVHITVTGGGSGYDLGNTQVRPYATGGTVLGPTRALVGEAGPEAIVPLSRPLSKVDPSVRWLSAIAQGKDPAMAGGGIAGAQSKTVIFEAGAIVVQGADDPRRAALEVADEVAERIGS